MENSLTANYLSQRLQSIRATADGPPPRTLNPFFGVGPITDVTLNEMDARLLRKEFEAWVESNYPKLDEQGNVVGNWTLAEINQGMHRGYPGEKVVEDMLRAIQEYFELPKTNRIAFGLGGGHTGFTVAAMHFMNPNDPSQIVYVDTPKPESEKSGEGGFFRQSWGVQLIELQRHAKSGDPDRIKFAAKEGSIPTAEAMEAMGVKLFFGVGHETTGATTYKENDLRELFDWIDGNPAERHAVIDVTSLLGGMVWEEELVQRVLGDCCLFTPFQKAIGGSSGYFVLSLTPYAFEAVERSQSNLGWAIPRQLKLAVPENPKKQLSSKKTLRLGPFFDPVQGKMLGGTINTFSMTALAETAFAVLRSAQTIGSVKTMNLRSLQNRNVIQEWLENQSLFRHGIDDPASRGAAVTLLKVVDPDIQDPDVHDRVIAKSKALLSYQGLFHPDGTREKGLDVARYLNPFPGTPGDYRAWVGGVRTGGDVGALLENLRYAYHRAKIVVLEEELVQAGVEIPPEEKPDPTPKATASAKSYRILVVDPLGTRLDSEGKPDCSSVKAHVEGKGGFFHFGQAEANLSVPPGLHFYYVPDLSDEAEILALTENGAYDAVIAAATSIPPSARFAEGGVRIGAGTGNMKSADWGGSDGKNGTAPLMNTPGFNARATAQAVFKALLAVKPDIEEEAMFRRLLDHDFDTRRHLKEYPSRKLEGQTIAVLGFGNIGRETAKIARRFGMKTVVYARTRHKEWIESEGMIHAASPAEAVEEADVVSLHLGLGPFEPANGRFANEGILNADALAKANPGAVLVNYDRAELVDPKVVDEALTRGTLAYAFVDADFFLDPNGRPAGPLAPFLSVARRHPRKLRLLPHAVADTEHASRVEGAKQAVDQIFEAILRRRVVNGVGNRPAGYREGGRQTPLGVGRAGLENYLELDDERLASMRKRTAFIAEFWGAVESVKDLEERRRLFERYSAELTLNANRYLAESERLGLIGPYAD